MATAVSSKIENILHDLFPKVEVLHIISFEVFMAMIVETAVFWVDTM
jgi:hypothetical protein